MTNIWSTYGLSFMNCSKIKYDVSVAHSIAKNETTCRVHIHKHEFETKVKQWFYKFIDYKQ